MALGANQLRATVSLEGASGDDMDKYEGCFVYSPPAETIMKVGNSQRLHVHFIPKHTTTCETAECEVFIDVLPKKLKPVIQVCMSVG